MARVADQARIRYAGAGVVVLIVLLPILLRGEAATHCGWYLDASLKWLEKKKNLNGRERLEVQDVEIERLHSCWCDRLDILLFRV
jgi:hypothetical protein